MHRPLCRLGQVELFRGLGQRGRSWAPPSDDLHGHGVGWRRTELIEVSGEGTQGVRGRHAAMGFGAAELTGEVRNVGDQDRRGIGVGWVFRVWVGLCNGLSRAGLRGGAFSEWWRCDADVLDLRTIGRQCLGWCGECHTAELTWRLSKLFPDAGRL
jgi:hypothetical protein